MKFSWLSWQNTPWYKANSGQWRYALRISLAMMLSLWIAFTLSLDQPYWAMTSAAVVSFPTIGGMISKSLGRIVGSIIGALAAMLIAGHTLSDPWLFTLFIAGWMALCTFMAQQQQNNVSYAFSLAGYTAAIIAFSTVNITDSITIFDIAQARLCEIITGILCATLMMVILPSSSDASALLTSLRQIHLRALEHATMVLKSEANSDLRSAHEGLIGKVLTMDVLRIQAFWTHYRLRRQNNLVNALLHRQLHLISQISGLRRMLLNWPDRPDNIEPIIQQLLKELAKPNASKYTLSRLLQLIRPDNNRDYRHHTLWLRLRTFCWSYHQAHRWLLLLESGSLVKQLNLPSVRPFTPHIDNYDAAYTAIRTFICIVIGCAFWISTGWTQGGSAITLTAICCILYASIASPIAGMMTMLKAASILFFGAFILKFGLFIQIGDFWLFALFMTPIIATLQLLKLQNTAQAGLWGQVIVFMGSYLLITDPPTYDYAVFINNSMANTVGILLAMVAFQVLKPATAQQKSRRLIRAQRRDFIDQLGQKPQLTESEFESLIYYRINQLVQSKDDEARLWLLRWSIVLINCSHVVWQLREWQTRSDPLSAVRDVCIRRLKGVMTEKGIQQRSLQHTLQELLRMSDSLSHHPESSARDLAGLIWRLYCSLLPLQQAIPSPIVALLPTPSE